MAYTPNRISAWMNDQSDDDKYAPRQPYQQLVRQEIDNMTVTESEHYWEFEEILEAFEKKMIHPLINALTQLQEAREHEKKLGNQRQAIRPVKITHMLDSRRIDPTDQRALLNIKTLFHFARTNFLSTSLVRSIIPSQIAINTWEEYAHHY